MYIKLTEINNLPYGQCDEIVEPSSEEIEFAIRTRVQSFQEHEPVLVQEWLANLEDCARLARQYHARRIAFFVENGWEDDPIEVGRDNWLIEGGHRMRAAKYLGLEKIHCVKTDRTKEEARKDRKGHKE